MPPTRVMDFPGWPPQSGGAYIPGDVFPLTAAEVTIENVVGVTDDHVAFTCVFGSRSASYDFFVPDEKTAKKVAKILTDNRRKSLSSIGPIKIPQDEGSIS